MKIVYKKGSCVDKKVDTIFNSANSFLLYGSGTAGDIRERSEILNFFEKIEYFFIFHKLSRDVREFYNYLYKKHKRKLTYAQLEAIKILLKNENINIGDAVLQEHWSKNDKRKIINVIAMSYELNPRKRIKATSSSIKKALTNALELSISIGSKKIVIPVLCSRSKTGISPKQSLDIILDVLKKFKNSSIKEVIICFDNEETEKYFTNNSLQYKQS